jgi:hypothetical protein
MDKTSLLLIYTDIHKTDVAYLQQLVKMLDARIYHQQLQKEKFSGLPTSSDLEKDHIASTIAFLHAVSALVSKISYKKGSIKERHRSMPWSSLEFLQHILVAYEDGSEIFFVISFNILKYSSSFRPPLKNPHTTD